LGNDNRFQRSEYLLISQVNGEVGFEDGLCIAAHAPLFAIAPSAVSSSDLPVPGWRQYVLGLHPSDHGDFQVEASVGETHRVEAVHLSHRHPFYQLDTTEDAGRRAYHEGVIASDLRGQLEFPWGHVFCHFKPTSKYDWLVVVYNPFANVPLQARMVEMFLAAHEPIPAAVDEDSGRIDPETVPS
jgi:hypothetical protein